MNDTVLVATEPHLTRLGILHCRFDVRRHCACLGVRHKTTRPQHLTQCTDNAHRVRRGNHNVKIHHAALDLLCQLFHADEIRAKLFCLIGTVALSKYRNAHLGACPMWQGGRTTNALV